MKFDNSQFWIVQKQIREHYRVTSGELPASTGEHEQICLPLAPTKKSER